MTRLTAPPDLTARPPRAWPGRLRRVLSARRKLGPVLPGVVLALLASGCLPSLFARAEPPPRVLHPQACRVVGTVWLQPRYARESSPLVAPVLLEPGDRIETGPGGKVEILLPQGVVRLYSHTRVQVLYAFEGRSAVSRELRLDSGEALFRKLASAPFVVQTEGLHVEPAAESTLLIASRAGVHQAACYQGAAEARNVRARGQTVVLLTPGHHLSVDDASSLAYLKDRDLPDEWSRWEEPDALASGLVPPPPKKGTP